MKFLCIACDEQMSFTERQSPGDGTFAAAFQCPRCQHSVALLANPMETQLVGALGVKIGGRTLEERPLEMVRGSVRGRDEAFVDAEPEGGRCVWSVAAQQRLARVPTFVRGMVKRIYTDYAVECGIREITPDLMDRARGELGLDGM